MKKLFVVFEGADGSGKTSLAQSIAKEFEVAYSHNDKSSSYEEGKKNSYDYIEVLKNAPTGVIDRLVHTGETVYAPIYRGYDGIDYFEDLENKMNEEFNILLVYVSANDEIVKERLKNRGEDYINIEDIKKIKDNYAKYLEKTKFPYILFDNSRDGLEANKIKLSYLIAAAIQSNFNK